MLSAAAACTALAWTVVVAVTGGVRESFGPILISSRSWERSGLIAVLFYVGALVLAKPGLRGQPWAWIAGRIEKHALPIALAAAAAVLTFGLQYGAHIAGGADSLGYVSQAYLWRAGDLHIEQPLSATAPWPFAAESLAPLGYKPGARRHTIVPTYSLGLPLMMAGTLATCGPCGPFYVGPVVAALLVLSTWLLAWRLTRSGLTSALAAVLMAASPAFLFNVVAPMSDGVTALLWIVALSVLTWPGVSHAAIAGIAAGSAILVRPNLAPLCLAGALAAEMWLARTGGASRRGRRALAFLAGPLSAVVAVGILNDHLYGSPFLTGYGPAADLYAFARLPNNLRLYTTWLFETQGIIILLALVPLVIPRARPAWLTSSRAVPLAVFLALLGLSYLLYLEFDGWVFLRFLLPAFPILFMLLATALEWLTRIAPGPVGVPALVAVTVAALTSSLGLALERGLPGVGEGEQRYAAVAEFIDAHLPPNAAVISLQHSGTIAFYAGRTTIRFEYLPRQRLKSVVDWLHENGYPPYIVLEEWEEPAFRRRFAAGEDALGRLEVRVLAESEAPHVRIRVYDPLQAAAAADIPAKIRTSRSRVCAEGRGSWKR
jgi:hypothetical protein